MARQNTLIEYFLYEFCVCIFRASALAFYVAVTLILLPVILAEDVEDSYETDQNAEYENLDFQLDLEIPDEMIAKRRAVPVLTQQERRDFLKEHNRRRSNVNPPATDMMQMVWNVELEMLASEWAFDCAYKFGTPPHTANAMQRLGQSIHISNDGDTVADVVTRWYGEDEFFVYSNDSGKSSRHTGGYCTEQHQCANYLQVVWAKSYQLGCSRSYCDRIYGLHNSIFDQSYFIVCYYGSSGQVPDAEPYIVGSTPCSNCPSNQFRCENQLCVPIKPCSMVNDCYMKYVEDCLCDESFYWSAFKKNSKLFPLSWSPPGNFNLVTYFHHNPNKASGPWHEGSDKDRPQLDCPVDVVREPGINSTIIIFRDANQTSIIVASPHEDRTYIWIIVGVVGGIVFVAAVAVILAVVCRRYLQRSRHSGMLEGRRQHELFHARSH